MVIRCPRCTTPLTRDEAETRRCPACGAALADADVTSIVAGPALPTRSSLPPESPFPFDARWQTARAGLDQMFQGLIIMLLGLGVNFMIGDAANRSPRQPSADILAALLFLLAVGTGAVFYVVGSCRCVRAPSPSGDWMIGYLVCLGIGVVMQVLIFAAAFQSGAEPGRTMGRTQWVLLGVAVVLAIAALICLTCFVTSICRVFANAWLAQNCRVFLNIQIFGIVAEFGLIIAVCWFTNGREQDPQEFKHVWQRQLASISQLLYWIGLAGGALWHAVMLYQAQKTIARGIGLEREPPMLGS